MPVTGFVSAVLIGIAIGVLARLIVPGRQRIGAFVTALVGVGAALLGTFVANALKLSDKPNLHWAGLDWYWWVLGIQIFFAIAGIVGAAALSHTFLAWQERKPQRRRTTRKARSND
jgi:uncharacterized membrane protein YeaQ/YmgE (transglycosylase-associated protein family)